MWSNVAMLNRYMWLAHLLLIMLIVALGMDMVKAYIRERPPAPSLELAPSSPMPDRSTQAAFADYQIIIERNLFNAHPREEDGNPQHPPPSDVATRQGMPLPLKLVGTVIRTYGQPYAMIENLRQQGAQAVYQIGDTIQHALIADIRPSCILLAQEGQEEWLCFQLDESVVGTTQSRPALPSAAADTTDDTDTSIDSAGRLRDRGGQRRKGG